MLVVGLYCVWALPGCERGGEFAEYKPAEVTEEDHEHGHDHDHEHHDFGPHDGHIIELGEHEYHAELVFDKSAHSLTVYLFGHELDEPLAIDQPSVSVALEVDGQEQAFTLTPAPQDGEAEGKSSRFELKDDATLAEHFDDVEDLKGHVEVTIQGRSYTGEISHDHEHHDHDHEHEHDDHAEDHAETADETPAGETTQPE
jgi:hypothetical protein